jgi:putative ABC transport system permease protein
MIHTFRQSLQRFISHFRRTQMDQALCSEPAVAVSNFAGDLDSLRSPRCTAATPFSFHSGFAKLMAGVGVYGLVPCVDSRRRLEVAICMALAADKRDITMAIPRQAMWPAEVGTLVALAYGAAVSSILSMNLSAALSVRLLCDTGLLGPVSFLLVPGFLLNLALPASCAAARGARHVKPMLALRHEWV